MDPILPSPILEVSGLRRDRAGREVLTSVELRLDAGARLGIVGRNGAGKTTLVRVLAGLLKPQAGTVLVQGYAAGSRAAGRLTGWMPERPVLPLMRVHDLLQTACALTGTDAERITSQSELLEISHLHSRPAGSLSQGEARLVALAMALLHQPKLLVLDEPFTALDGPARERVVRAVSAQPNVAIVATAHDAASLEGIVDQVQHLADGRLQDPA